MSLLIDILRRMVADPRGGPGQRLTTWEVRHRFLSELREPYPHIQDERRAW